MKNVYVNLKDELNNIKKNKNIFYEGELIQTYLMNDVEIYFVRIKNYYLKKGHYSRILKPYYSFFSIICEENPEK